MLAVERHSRINAALRSTGTVSTEGVAQELGVSLETVRRDFVLLERRGSLARVHGGATTPLAHTGEEAPFVQRTGTAREAKKLIGRTAVSLMQPGQTIIIDIGTTAVSVARAIPKDFAGTIATCSLLVAAEFTDHARVEVLVCGGKLRGGDLALSNSMARSFFADLHADIAFLGSGGVDVDAGLTDFYLEEVAVRKTIVKNSARAYALADSSKFGRVARFRVADLSDLTGVITETEPSQKFRTALARIGGALVLPQRVLPQRTSRTAS